MDLQKEWNTMQVELAGGTAELTINMKEIKRTAKGAYEKLLDNLAIKLIWIQVIAIAALAATLFTTGLLQKLLLLWFVVYAFGAIITKHKMDKLPRYVDYTNVTRSVLQQQLKAIQAILRLESNSVYFFGPFAGPTGLLAGLLLTYKTFDAVQMRFPNIWIYLLASALLVFVIKWWGDKWNKIAFQKDIDKLNQNLNSLEE